VSADLANLTDAGLDFSVSGSVATVTLSRPERRNAMTPSMWRGLARIGAAIPDDVRVVVVRGAGPSFCAGIDLRMFSADGVPGEERNPSASDPGFPDSIAGFQAGYLWLRNPAFVSIAAVQGHAIGGGFQLALILGEGARIAREVLGRCSRLRRCRANPARATGAFSPGLHA